MKKVIIESLYAGDIERNIEYARKWDPDVLKGWIYSIVEHYPKSKF
jgi:hypothetical protein